MCIKKHQRGDNSKSIKARALVSYATHRHDLFYITMKYHQNIPNGFQVIERTRDGRTAGCQAHRCIRSGDKAIRSLGKVATSAKKTTTEPKFICTGEQTGRQITGKCLSLTI